VLTIKAMSGGETYAARHLSSNDYFSEEERVVGQWMGRGAQLLGLEGQVQIEDFEAIRRGLHPSTGEDLRPRQSADRFTAEGKRTGTARNLYDFTVSAPKSLSIQSLVDPRLVEAHTHAVQETAREMERLAASRIRRRGANDNRFTGNLVIAAYQHDTSRQLDPQLHTHLVAGNLTFDGDEGRWKALQAAEIYGQREYLTEVYRNALAARVLDCGYCIRDRFEHGQERGFEIDGITRDTLDKFSQRSAQRDQAIAAFIDTTGRLPTDNEVARLVRDTRPDKLIHISTPEVRARQWARMTPEESNAIRALELGAQKCGSTLTAAEARPSLNYAREHLFERVSVAKDYELKVEALRHGRGRIALGELKTAIAADASSGILLQTGVDVATNESLARERQMIQTVNAGISQHRRLGGGAEFIASDRLRPEQKHAIEFVLDSRDLAVNLRGAAGTGKTATFQELKRALAEARRGVAAVAPTTSAVEELQEVGFTQATTIARLLQDPQQQAQLRGQVLIVDEAGMVSSKDMSQLLRLAKHSGAQIVFSGDTRQIKSVDEGDALRILESESKLRTVSLSQVQRQTSAEYREAVQLLRRDPAAALDKFEAMGAIQEIDWVLRAQATSRAYRQALAEPNAQGLTRSVLVIAATYDEIHAVTHAIRHDHQQAGELGAGQTITRHEPLNWTEAQKRQMSRYQPGFILEFHKAVKGVKRNEALEVVSADKEGITTRNTAGRELRLTPRQSKAFGVFAEREFEVAAGDRLLLQANRHEKGFRATNGELVTVAAVEAGRVHLADGRTVPSNYKQLTYGYAVTTHRGQGKTVDSVIISADRMDQDLFYVAATRGRESLTVITSDKEALRDSIGISGERESASELARRLIAEPTEIQRLQYAFAVVQESRVLDHQEHTLALQQIHQEAHNTNDHGHRISM
jgi:conjugative relaxase-like TrwC/TraI family protein